MNDKTPQNDEKITPGDLTFGTRKKPADEAEKTEFQKKVENFFYYHKWKVIAGVFAVFVIVICSLQMCRKTSPDVYLVYAGTKNVNKYSQNGDISEYQKLLTAVKVYAKDENNDGKVTVSMETLFVLSADEKAAIEATLRDGESLNETQLSENRTSLSESLLLGDTFVYLLSESAYEQNRDLFLSLASYAPADLPAEAFYAENAVLLSKIPLGEKPGFSMLPEDTVLCLRMRNEGLGSFGKSRSELHFIAAETLVRELLKG